MESFTGNAGVALLLTLVAGLSTGIGSLIALRMKKTSAKFLAVSLGFSAGVMIYVSTVELFRRANDSLILHLGERKGTVAAVTAFFGGILFIFLIDRLVPRDQNPHEIQWPVDGADEEQQKGIRKRGNSLLRTGVFTAAAIALHNFPEGLATFVSAMQNMSIAIPVVAAVAIHNIPEGLAISVPIYYATGSKKKALIYSFLSGLAEPLGAVVGYCLLFPFMNEIILGLLFAAVAGILVFVSLDELLPAARKYGQHHLAMYGLVGGMLVMAVSLLLFM